MTETIFLPVTWKVLCGSVGRSQPLHLYGSIMDGWTKDEKVMIAYCNDGTRPVVLKIEHTDEE